MQDVTQATKTLPKSYQRSNNSAIGNEIIVGHAFATMQCVLDAADVIDMGSASTLLLNKGAQPPTRSRTATTTIIFDSCVGMPTSAYWPVVDDVHALSYSLSLFLRIARTLDSRDFVRMCRVGSSNIKPKRTRCNAVQISPLS